MELITGTPDTALNESVCTTSDSQFGEDRLSTANVAGEIRDGAYIIRDPDFTFTCSGCIQSIHLAVSTTSTVRDAQGREMITFQIFRNRTTDKSIFERTLSFSWNSSIFSNETNRRIIEYRGDTEVCFRRGDTLGFTVEADSGVALLATFVSEGAEFIFNVSTQLSTSVCPQLNGSGLYQFDAAPLNNLQLVPLINIETGTILYLFLDIALVIYLSMYCNARTTARASDNY